MLASEEFHLFLIAKNILLFGVDVNSEEGARVSYILRESRYPFLSLIMLRGSRMTVVGRFEGKFKNFTICP